MAFNVEYPSSVTLEDGSIVTNKQVTIHGNNAYVTLYAQIIDTETSKTVSGPRSFSAHADKDHPKAYDSIFADLERDIQAWKDEFDAGQIFRSDKLGDLESDLSASVKVG